MKYFKYKSKYNKLNCVYFKVDENNTVYIRNKYTTRWNYHSILSSTNDWLTNYDNADGTIKEITEKQLFIDLL